MSNPTDTTSNPANDALMEGAMPDGHVPYGEEIDHMTTETRNAYSVWRRQKAFIVGTKDIRNRKAILELWETLGDIPVDDNQCIELPFLHFGEGTALTDVWDWFEEELDYPVYLLQRGKLIPGSTIESEFPTADETLLQRVGAFVEVSTAHITGQDRMILESHYMTWEHVPGFDVNCNDFEGLVELKSERGVSKACLDILMWGYEHDLTFVRFHPDGAYVGGLPTFDW